MKLTIYEEEVYPVFIPDNPKNLAVGVHTTEVDDEVAKRWRITMLEFEKMQSEIAKTLRMQNKI